MKKIIILFTAIILWFLPVQSAMFPNEAHAITGKVISLAAKKMAKEVIKESAIQTAGNLALKEFFEDRTQKYDVKDDFKLICLPGGKNADGTCDKPMQIKETITSADKANIDNAVDVELEKTINGGKNFTRFQKFVDWVAPIFLVSLVATALSYAFDPDVKSLFDEVAINVLISLGIMQPVPDVSGSPEKKIENGDYDTTTTPDLTAPRIQKKTETLPYSGTFRTLMFDTPTTNLKNYTFIFDMNYNAPTTFSPMQIKRNPTSNLSYTYPRFHFNLLDNGVIYMSYDPSVTVTLNGQSLVLPTNGQIFDTRIKNSSIGRVQYSWNGTTEFITTYLENGDIYKVQGNTGGTTTTRFQYHHQTPTGATGTFDTYVIPNSLIAEVPTFTPTETELAETIKPTQNNPYAHGDATYLTPPMSLPYSLPDGTPVYPVPNPAYDPVTNPSADPNIFVDPTGAPVQDPESIIVGDPVITKDPWGNPQVEPPPSPSQPNPEPIPLSEPKLEPDIPTDEPIFPKGESCDVGLKLPKFNPLMHTISDAFPFSIPFDLKDGFDAIFAEMGSEKPEFDYKFSFMGEEQSWNITIPDYFDSWKAFTDSFLIFIFDIGIIYAIYRFMGGGN